MKRIAILGSTGSIGRNALAVIRNFPDKFKICALSAHSKVEILYRQLKEFRPACLCLHDHRAAGILGPRLRRTRLFQGEQGLLKMLEEANCDMVLLAVTGSSALLPLLKAIDLKYDIALANKEALVMAGRIIMRSAEEKKVKIVPIDSEQSAIWQCLEGEDKKKIKRIYLTASGGPFRLKDKSELKKISILQALRHPRWKMGKKISVDSANLMNKGLELIEAMHLFGVEANKIKIVVHPQAIIHSMVEFIDGVVLAQLSVTDMRIPIQYALSYPERLKGNSREIDFYKLKNLDFEKPDFRRFPCLALALEVADTQGTLPCVLNAANEVSVDKFLKGKLSFLKIPQVLKRVLDNHRNIGNPGLKEILAADSWARQEAERVIAG